MAVQLTAVRQQVVEAVVKRRTQQEEDARAQNTKVLARGWTDPNLKNGFVSKDRLEARRTTVDKEPKGCFHAVTGSLRDGDVYLKIVGRPTGGCFFGYTRADTDVVDATDFLEEGVWLMDSGEGRLRGGLRYQERTPSPSLSIKQGGVVKPQRRNGDLRFF